MHCPSNSGFPIAMQSGTQTNNDSITLGELFEEFSENTRYVLSGLQAFRQQVGKTFVRTQKTVATGDPVPRTLSDAEKMNLAKQSQTAAILDWLSQDANSVVRNELLANRNLPRFVLAKLACDPDRFIASQARALL